MRPSMSAFITTARSIPDYLLEDYNTRLGLNIPLTEKLTFDRFKDEAKMKSNQKALRFINFYKDELNKLYQKEIGKLMFT